MARKIVGTFRIEHLQVLDESGKADPRLMPKLPDSKLVRLYELMTVCRRFDEKALILQKQGRLGTYASFRGQEASQVGAAAALSGADWIFPTYRDSALLIARNTPMENVLMYFGGDERGSIVDKNVNNFPISIPVGTQGLHATGAAMAAAIRKQRFAALACFGDGASSQGDLSESMNFAGVFKAPVVFLCQNNQFAISVPFRQQTASATVAQKAVAFGFEGVRVDGNDVLAVYSAVSAALKKAYSGKGPTLIECLTYRVGDHTTSDDASRYRSESEVKQWLRKDPVMRLRKLLERKKLWNDKKEAELHAKAAKLVSDAVERYESVKPANVDDIFKYAYATTPEFLKEQLEEYKRMAEGD